MMKRLLFFLLVFMVCCGHVASDRSLSLVPPEPTAPVEPLMIRPFADDVRCRQWVDSVMEELTLEERIGQLFIYTIAPQPTKKNRELLRKVVKDYKVGGLLFSGGQLQNQVTLTNEAQRMAEVPLLMTFDGEWGLAMRLRGTPSFPRNMVLGCIQDDSLIYEYGREVARQCRELGVQVNFAPVADVNINPENPVINTRSFGESPVNVASKVIAYATGLESGGVLSVSKHFPGHGDTDTDSHKELPLLPFSRERLDSVELYPFKKAIRAGVSGIMVGHLEVPVFEVRNGLPSSLSRNVVYDLLTRELKFQGLVFTDALAMKGVGESATLCLQALKAGNDLLLVPRRIKEEVAAVHAAVKHGELSREEIDAKCRKVLTYKYALGLNKKPHIRLSGLTNRIDRPHTRDLIRRLNLASITVLGNDSELLPLDPVVRKVAVLNVGEPNGLKPFLKELSVYTQPKEFCLTQDMTEENRIQLMDSLANYKRVVVGISGRKLASYKSFFDNFTLGVPVTFVAFVSGKELVPIEKCMAKAGAVVLAHSSEDDVQCQVAKILYGKACANGRLSASIGSLFAAGAGTDVGPRTVPHFIPEEHGMNSQKLACIDSIAQEGIRRGAYPGCQIVVWKDGKEMYNKAFGTHGRMNRNGTAEIPVKPTDVYDIASLTKTTATLLAVMKLYDEGKLNLTDRIGDILPFLKNTDKRNITIRELLLHESGLPSTLLFYGEAIDKDSYRGGLYKQKPDKLHSVRIGASTWANSNFRFKKGLVSKVRTSSHVWQVSDSLWLDKSFKQIYLKKIADAPLRDKRYRYSCVGFIVLQQVVETLSGLPLDAYLEKVFYAPMGLTHTAYLPLQRLPKEEIVPSSSDPFLRKTVLRGYVHDESAAFQGGVSGNAGLFSNAGEVAKIYQMLLNGGELDGKRYLSRETCRFFTTSVSKISRRGLGFDKPDSRHPEKSPCGKLAPASVYGHTGFTGTCAWVDPDNRLVYVFLSNRIYPDVWNTKLMKLDIRTRIQDAIYRSLIKE